MALTLDFGVPEEKIKQRKGNCCLVSFCKKWSGFKKQIIVIGGVW